MHFDASRLRWPEWLLAAGATLLLVSMFLLPWFAFPTFSGPPGPPLPGAANKVDGWHGLTQGRWLLLLAVLFALAAWFSQARRKAPAVPVTLALLAMWFGGLSVLWLVYRVIINPPGGRELGGWVGLIAAVAVAYGGYRSVRMEGIADEDAPHEIPVAKLGDEGAT